MKGNVIGVTPLYCDEKKSVWMLPGYLDMLRAVGLVPVILPDIATEEELRRLDHFCDGYLFTGGHDVDPALYDAVPSPLCGSINHNRDRLEERLFRIALASDKPILGICRGIQLINVLLGGTLYQDLDSEHPSSVEHHMLPPYNRTVHRVTLESGILSSLIREWEFGVNSYHHQAICRLAPVLHTEAVSQDGLIEGVSCPDMRFLLAVQWHPELIYREDPRNFAIVKAFADAVRGI